MPLPEGGPSVCTAVPSTQTEARVRVSLLWHILGSQSWVNMPLPSCSPHSYPCDCSQVSVPAPAPSCPSMHMPHKVSPDH